MKTALLALVAPLAIGSMPAMASDYRDGLNTGDVIVTCMYLQAGRFKEDPYGEYMLRISWPDLRPTSKENLMRLWLRDGDYKCVRAVR